MVPYIMVAWIVIGIVYLTAIVRRRPDILDAMGRAMGEEAPRPSTRSSPQPVMGE